MGSGRASGRRCIGGRAQVFGCKAQLQQKQKEPGLLLSIHSPASRTQQVRAEHMA